MAWALSPASPLPAPPPHPCLLCRCFFYTFYLEISVCCCLVVQSGPTLLQSCGLYLPPQTPLPMEFLKQEHWNGLPFLTLEDLPNLGIEPASLALGGGFFTTEPPRKLCKDVRTDYSRCYAAAARGSGQRSSGEAGENHAERRARAVRGEAQMACAKVLW